MNNKSSSSIGNSIDDSDIIGNLNFLFKDKSEENLNSELSDAFNTAGKFLDLNEHKKIWPILKEFIRNEIFLKNQIQKLLTGNLDLTEYDGKKIEKLYFIFGLFSNFRLRLLEKVTNKLTQQMTDVSKEFWLNYYLKKLQKFANSSNEVQELLYQEIKMLFENSLEINIEYSQGMQHIVIGDNVLNKEDYELMIVKGTESSKFRFFILIFTFIVLIGVVSAIIYFNYLL
ncbi:MAG: hypothetical protein ACXAC7_09445 [Candidatus Hodarchaeales archaeon]|jgi:hypothetical protein